MKPVIKKQTHYSLLLMRDDKNVYDLRVKTTTIRTCLILFILLLIGGGGGIAGGAHYWKKYRALQTQHKEQEVALAEARLQLEHYVNKEALEKEKTGVTVLTTKNVEIGAEARAQKTLQAANATLSQAQGSATRNATQTQGSTARNATLLQSQGSATRNATEASTLAVSATDASPAAVAGSAQANATAQASANATTQTASTPEDTLTAAPPVDSAPRGPSLNSDNSPLRISGFSSRPAGYQRLRIIYELSTAEERQPPVSGHVKYLAVFTNGTRLPLELQRAADARFSISRMKPMEGSVRLPQGYATKDIESIDLTVELEENGQYHDIYPFTK